MKNEKKTYVNSNILSVSYNVPLESVLQKDGNNYKYSDSGKECIFVMTSGVLTSIVVSGALVPGYNDEYFPHKYNNSRISKPVGYTGDIEFITNASYTSDSDVTVKVNGTPLTLNTDYTLAHGSTHVKLLGNYVKTLPVGTHTMTVGVTGYSDIDQDFVITAVPTSSPETSGATYTVPNTSVN